VPTPGHEEPPLEFIWYSLDEAKDLLLTLQDVLATLERTGHFAGVIAVDRQLVLLTRKLELEGPNGGAADDR
jgi:hypothetical protein